MSNELYPLSSAQIRDLNEISVLEVNSNKPLKEIGAVAFLSTLLEGHLAADSLTGMGEWAGTSPQAEYYQEPRMASAALSAEHKAGWLRHFGTEVATTGMDSVVRILTQDSPRGEKRWVTLHKLEREIPSGKPNAEQIAGEYRMLRDLLVYPMTGQVHVAWELSASFINGTRHTFTDYLLVRSKPLERQLFWRYFETSLKSGHFTRRAPRIDLIEAIFENDPKAQVGIFSEQQMGQQGERVWNRLTRADSAMKMLALQAVLTTAPHAIYTEKNNFDVLEKAVELSTHIGEGWQ